MPGDARAQERWDDCFDDAEHVAFDGWAPTLDEADQRVSTLLFSVSNPPRTVTAAVFIDGRVHRVELSPSVTSMAEPQLAEEITIVANLARQKARAAQHAVVVQLMSELGHDAVATTGFLRRDLGLPSPDDFRAASSAAFVGRYRDD